MENLDNFEIIEYFWSILPPLLIFCLGVIAITAQMLIMGDCESNARLTLGWVAFLGGTVALAGGSYWAIAEALSYAISTASPVIGIIYFVIPLAFIVALLFSTGMRIAEYSRR